MVVANYHVKICLRTSKISIEAEKSPKVQLKSVSRADCRLPCVSVIQDRWRTEMAQFRNNAAIFMTASYYEIISLCGLKKKTFFDLLYTLQISLP